MLSNLFPHHCRTLISCFNAADFSASMFAPIVAQKMDKFLLEVVTKAEIEEY